LLLKPEEKTKIKKRERGNGSNERHYFILEETGRTFSDLKAPSECLLVSLTEVTLRGGKALGSEEGKALRSELRCRGNNLGRGFNVFGRTSTLEKLHQDHILISALGGLHVNEAVQRGIWIPTQQLLYDRGNPWKTLKELVPEAREREERESGGGSSE
jgi:hypothetical protein